MDDAGLSPPAQPELRTTVLIVLDPGRADQVGPQTMPFLSGLAKRSMVGSFAAPPDPRDHTLLFTGSDPQRPGDAGMFLFDPDTLPPRWMRRTGLARLARTVRKAGRALRTTSERLLGRPLIPGDPDPLASRHILQEGHASISSSHETPASKQYSIFDLCRDHGRTARYLGAPALTTDDAVHDTLVREVRDGDPSDLFIARFTNAHEAPSDPYDQAPYRVGLRDLDDKIASIHAALTARYDSWDLLVCSEEALAPMDRQVDLQAALRRLDATEGTDYIVSTTKDLASFWYLTGKGRAVIEAKLPYLSGTILLDEAGRRRRRLPLDRRWGDRLVATREGAVFAPATAVTRTHPRWTRAEATAGRQGVAILASNNGHTPPRDLGRRAQIDLLPTLCDLVGIPVPHDHDGKSLIEREGHDALH